MKLTLKKLKTLINEVLSESSDYLPEIEGMPPEKVQKLMGLLTNEDIAYVKQGISIASQVGMPEDQIVAMLFEPYKGWKQDGVNWVLLEEFPTNPKWEAVTEIFYHGEAESEKLTELPDNIKYLANLEAIGLPGHKLTSLPDSLGNLTNLKTLGLGSNQLTSLPNWIGNLKNLIYLDLSGNELTSLPDSIGVLTNLKRLYLSQNQLTSLPKSIGNLTNLTVISLRDNPLTVKPTKDNTGLAKAQIIVN